ncbi:MAG: phosphate signaling complex PhoU family protein [Acidimicrobiales bacterium]
MTVTGLSGTDLRSIDTQVGYLFAMVSEGLAAATAAFLSGDRDAARDLSANDHHVDELQLEIERLVFREVIDHHALSRDELAHLLQVMQIVPELERSGDLVEHIALRTPQDLAQVISPRCRGLIQQMGAIAVEMWHTAATAFRERDPAAAARLRLRDDDLDDLHVTLTSELAAVALPVPVAIEMGLVARFFERLGDHAVNVSRRVALR